MYSNARMLSLLLFLGALAQPGLAAEEQKVLSHPVQEEPSSAPIHQLSPANPSERMYTAGWLSQQSYDALSLLQDALREPLMEVDHCFAHYEATDDDMGPVMFVEDGAHVQVDTRSCQESAPESTPGTGDPLDDPHPDNDSSSEGLYDFCDATSIPNMWNCQMFSSRPCGPGDADEGCLPIDPQNIYPLEEVWTADANCEGEPIFGCSVTIDRWDLEIDYGPEHFDQQRYDVQACAQDPSKCPDGVVDIFVSCDAAPAICELQIDVESIGHEPSVSQEGCVAGCVGKAMKTVVKTVLECYEEFEPCADGEVGMSCARTVCVEQSIQLAEWEYDDCVDTCE